MGLLDSVKTHLIQDRDLGQDLVFEQQSADTVEYWTCDVRDIDANNEVALSNLPSRTPLRL